MSTLVTAAIAQAPDHKSADQIGAIDRISWMAGVWEGTSSTDRGPQGKSESLSWERVRRSSGGTALIIEGRHFRKNADGSRGERVHDATALVTFDPATGKYRFTWQLADGSFGTSEGRAEGSTFIWERAVPQGIARFRITHENGRWTESGEFCVKAEPGTPPPCRPFFGMSLARVADTAD